GLGLEDTFNRVAPTLDREGRMRLSERYRHHFLAREAGMPLYDGVPEMLARLHGSGRRLAVATGKARRGLERALDATGLRPWVDGSSRTGDLRLGVVARRWQGRAFRPRCARGCTGAFRADRLRRALPRKGARIREPLPPPGHRARLAAG